MIKVVSIEHMRRIEAAADASGLSYDAMMENAGRAAAHRAIDILKARADDHIISVVILIGAGNNGGDGLVAARYIAQETEAIVSCYLLKPRDDDHFHTAENAGVKMINADDDPERITLKQIVDNAQLIIDALFGIGVRIPLQGTVVSILKAVQNTINERKSFVPDGTTIIANKPVKSPAKPFQYVLAIDCPSGVDCDTGQIDDNILPSDETITFIAAKPGLFLPPALNITGTLSVATLGISPNLPEIQESNWHLSHALDIQSRLPERSLNSHKGTYGKAMIIAGSTNYFGAPALAAEAAYRSGAGLVTVGAPGPVVQALAANLPEPTWIMLPHDLGVISEKAAPVILEQLINYNSLLIGPGLAQEDTTGNLLKHLLKNPSQTIKQTKKRAIGFGQSGADHGEEETGSTTLPPLIIDADGLNLLSKVNNWWELLPPNTIITPHPGEMARLTGQSTKEVSANRWQLVLSKAAEWDVIVLLKGAHTLIANPQGELHVLPFKTDALATAGSGDILAGLIVGLLAQEVSAYNAAVVGGYIHGLCGELAQESTGYGSGRGVIARDILAQIPQAIALMRI